MPLNRNIAYTVHKVHPCVSISMGRRHLIFMKSIPESNAIFRKEWKRLDFVFCKIFLYIDDGCDNHNSIANHRLYFQHTLFLKLQYISSFFIFRRHLFGSISFRKILPSTHFAHHWSGRQNWRTAFDLRVCRGFTITSVTASRKCRKWRQNE